MAEQNLAEIGTNIKEQFPTEAHLCSWAAVIPGHNESAGKGSLLKESKETKI
ncbi:IS110 family transposase [Paenibacillus endophyticus]|uniref:IS110 family transposase n=1 Tax=Paenibacillus endophyticus TaxID=1294268 RepID=UPI001FE44316|nr:IS110 family transposase [Paenibacillus endophyticus]